MTIRSIDTVVQRQLCTGCGACAYAEPARYQMADIVEVGRRPVVRSLAAAENGKALRLCPGAALRHPPEQLQRQGALAELVAEWGPVLGVWEGYASDPELRAAGSSGGAASALALFALEGAGMSGVLHSAARPTAPWLNEAVISTSRSDLLGRTGSRYAPASPAERLGDLLALQGESVFIGKPCDVAAARKAMCDDAALERKLGLLVAFFCAGVPSTRGTLELLKREGIEDPAALTGLRYRGNGWPGLWRAEARDAQGEQTVRELSYADSWAFLQKYRQWRCHICPDHTGEFADIAVGDPWYRPIEPGEPGKSLIVARTERGLRFLRAAAASGYLHLEREDAALLPGSQPNLLATRGALWGRLLALRLLGGAVPQFVGFSLFGCWLKHLSMRQKFQSLFGTAKRIRSKRLWRRLTMDRAADAEIGAAQLERKGALR